MKGVLSVLFVLIMGSVLGQNFEHNPSSLVSEYSKTAQFDNIKLLEITENKLSVDVPNEITGYEIFTLDQGETDQFKATAPEGFNLPLSLDGSTLDLNLVKVDISASAFTITEQPSGISHPVDIGLHYRGVVEGVQGSVVAISVLEDEISGLISIPGIYGNIVLGKIENSSKHILYSDAQLKDEFEFSCLTEPFELDKAHFSGGNKNLTSKCPEIFIDISNEIFVDKGSVDNAVSYVVGLFNQVAALYANDNVNILLHGLNVWTTSEEFVTLGQYRAYRQNNPVGGDFKAYLNYSFNGGVAYTVGICGSFIYSISGIESNFDNVPTYSWSVLVLAHELGHNMGSPHTHACSWNQNNSAIDGCGFEAGYSEGCSGDIPKEGGTIMSYCHLNEVGINFSNGFGIQPAQLIRNNLDDSNCIDSCFVGPTCYDGIQNGEESGVDCGGPDCMDCSDCPASIIYLPMEGISGPAIDLCDAEVIPFNYSVADYQLCAQEILDSNPQCLEEDWGQSCQQFYMECVAIAEYDCSVFESAPVDLSKSYDPVDGIEDRIQVKFFKSSPQVPYAPKDKAACDIMFWEKRNLNPETGQIIGEPILDADSTLLSKVKPSENTPFFKWPIKYKALGANNSKRVDPNKRYEWKVRCYCLEGNGPVSPWSEIKLFNTPDFDIISGQNLSGMNNAEITDKKIGSSLSSLRIYPNPTKGIINISLNSTKGDKIQLAILDLLGKTHFEKETLSIADKMKYQIDVSEMENGNYILHVQNPQESIVYRLIIDK
ncbi:MAG: T9SS type A sorting domain-containing protein [Flavobacteriales bacterium]|nr:T9SS type A sorting domain-containing protein [Flavobacteriales bacterium]